MISNTKIMLGACALVLALVLTRIPRGAADDEPQAHSRTCPQACEKCAIIVKKSLDWLATQQTPAGNWKAGNGGMWVTTATAVLAFHAHGSTVKDGPYATNIKKAVDFFIENMPKEQKKYPCMNWDTAFVLLAMAEVYAHHPDQKHKEFIDWLINLIAKNQFLMSEGRGGWGHHSKNYGDLGATTMYGNFIAPSLWNVAALGIARQLGFAGDDEMFKRGILYLRAGIVSDGGIGYYGVPPSKPQTRGSEPGRTAGVIWALDRAGATDPVLVPRMKQYFTAKMSRTPYSHAAVILHYLHGALAAKLIGEPVKSQYWQLWRDKMLREVTPEGFFQNRWLKGDYAWWGEVKMGNNFSAGCFPLIFMLDSPHLKTWFNLKIDPIDAPVPETLLARVSGTPPPQPPPTALKPPTKPQPIHPQTDLVVPPTGERPEIIIPRPPPRPDAAPWLGANFQEVEGRGLLIVAVADDGSLARAGLEAGDLLTHFNNQPVKSAKELAALMEQVNVGDTVTVKFVRGSVAKSVDLQIVGEP